MASVRYGGDPEGYMDPPSMTSTDSAPGGGSFIASVLDALGIHKQVANGGTTGKKESAGGAAAESTTNTTNTTQSVPSANLPALAGAESAFQPVMPMPTDWGKKYLESIKPLKTVDPNQGM